ncbi:MAG: hypothetical protein ABW221_04670 [Vicinamibacteria bacterium]
MRATRIRLPFLLVALLALAPVPAYAYIDPGTGSFLFQAIAATLIGGIFFVRMSWQRIRERMKRLLGSRRDD